MSVLKFEEKVLSPSGLSDNDRTWFPRWLRRYALAQRGGGALPREPQSGISGGPPAGSVDRGPVTGGGHEGRLGEGLRRLD
ncbi:hypothetical protein Rcae01_00660 [Novipirellula caenicola]|uniref:Uncharacterized protein n=1 Tax=Novipirellula caenicola TaxID=1536901 RepID=A0ABP9VM38_9BACT